MTRRSAVFGPAGLPLAGLFMATCLAAQQPRDTLGLRPAFRRIDEYVARRMQSLNTPGLSLALVDRSGLLTVRSYGLADLERRRPVTPATRFQIGSISKSFTALALMQLADSARFDPARAVRTYLPWFTPPTRWRPVTGHDLLTHTSGLPADRDDIPSSPAQGYLARLRPLGSAPGTHWAYSNIGYQVLGQVLTRLDGRSYPEAITARILGPLGMRATAAEFTNATRLDLAVGYQSLHDDRPTRNGDPLVPAPWVEYASGDGSIVSTTTDLGRYLTMLLNQGDGPAGRLVSPERFRALVTPHALTERNGDHYGYGFFLGPLDQRSVFWHSGGMLGYSTYLIGEPALGVGAVVFVNGPGAPGAVARFALRALLAAMLGDSLPPLPEEVPATHVDDAPAYAGVFAGAGDTLRFEAGGDSLVLLRGDRREALEAWGEDSFLGPVADFPLFPIHFGRQDGRVVEAWYGDHWYHGAGYRGAVSFTTPAVWNAYVGHYRIMQPWEPTFRVLVRKGQLLWVGPEGDEEPLTPLGGGEFRLGGAGSAERLSFGDIVDGHALSATLSGMTYYRFFTP